MKLPKKFLGSMLTSFQTHLKCRGKKFVMLRVTFALRAAWKIFAPFLDANTKERTIMSKKGTHEYLQENIHSSQLEQKYGGEAPNLEKYWPPTAISSNYG